MGKRLDNRQFRLWHRLRRVGRPAFVGGLGTVGTTGVVILFHVVVVMLMLGLPWAIIVRYVGWLVLIVAPLCTGAFWWTWWLMERRYRFTLAALCPRCGYEIRGLTSERCPECGSTLAPAIAP